MTTKFTEALESFYAAVFKDNSLSDTALNCYEAVLTEFNKQMFDAIIQREFVMALARGANICCHYSDGAVLVMQESHLPTQAEKIFFRPKLTEGFSITQQTPPCTDQEKTESEIYKLIGLYTGPDSIKPEIMPTLGMLIAKRNELEKIQLMGELNEVQPAS